MTLFVGKPAPDFTSMAILPNNKFDGEFNLNKYLGGNPGVVFFYSFVCPTELVSIQNRMIEFNRRKLKVVAVGVDSHMSHLKWRATPVEEGGIGHVDFPLVSDVTRRLAKGYDVLVNDAIALRGTFLIDKIGVVRYQAVHDLPLGRNVDEILRVYDSLKHNEETGDVIPAGWSAKQPGIAPDEKSLCAFMQKNKLVV